MEPLLITLDLPPGPLSPNARPHHRVKNKAKIEYREHARDEAMAACYAQNVKEPFREAIIGITYFHRSMRFADRDNILASLKAAWDGFTLAGLWLDDHEVIYLPVAREKDSERPRVEVVVYGRIPTAWKTFVDSLKHETQ